MYFLIYASTAARNLTEVELLDLLASARRFNQRTQLTGMLLYSPGTGTQKGTFVQVLEGPRADVQSLYLHIKRDSRHQDCTVMGEGELFQRRFAEWTMGFRDLSTLKPSQVPGFNPIFLKQWTLAKVLAEPDPVLQLLYSFAGES